MALGVSDFGKTVRVILAEKAVSTGVLVFEKNEHVYNWGDRGRCLYLLEQGRVKATKSSEGGKQCLLDIYVPGDVFGELCLISEARIETITAMTTVVVHEIPSAAFRLLLADQGVLEAFFVFMGAKLAEQQQMITNLVTMDSRGRLAAVLLQLGRKLGERCPGGLRLRERITHEELSAMVGTTRSRIGYFLNLFQEEGLIRCDRGRVIIKEQGENAWAAAWPVGYPGRPTPGYHPPT